MQRNLVQKPPAKYPYKEYPRFGFFETKSDKKQQERKKNRANKLLNILVQEAKKSKILVKHSVFFSDPLSKGIISYVNERDFDLAILEHPKITRFEESYYSSTVCELHKGLKCPLLLLN